MGINEMSGLIPMTALYVGLHALLAVVLANFVLYARLRSGKVPAWQSDAALRVQANFVENVPLALLLFLVLEIQGTSPLLLHGFGSSLFIMRLLHAFGLGTYPGANYPRLIGAQGTFVLIAIMAIGALGSAF
jgi:uncharacterized membrane protein YecN with MAPEG domain